MNRAIRKDKEESSMFLNLLNEKEGKNFLELAKIAMMVNGTVKAVSYTHLEHFQIGVIQFRILD